MAVGSNTPREVYTTVVYLIIYKMQFKVAFKKALIRCGRYPNENIDQGHTGNETTREHP